MDFFGPREILVVVCVLVSLAILLDGMRRAKRNRYEKLQMSSRKMKQISDAETEVDDAFADSQFPSGGSRVVGIRDEADIQHVEDSLRRSSDAMDFNFSRKPQQEQFDLDNSIFERERAELNRRAAAEADQLQKKAEAKADASSKDMPQEVLVMHLMANKGETINGQKLLDQVLIAGLRFGGRKIFDRHINDDGSGEVLFSLANVVNPGTFDLNTIAEMETPGVTLFMPLDDLSDPVSAFDTMVDAVDSLAAGLQLNVMDESRSSMTKQTIDHYRQRARTVSFRREQSS
ncbi:MAG: cell division protein ZipA [Porticoccaceae bacterium]|nr:cell division protein ZipA [Porticoccaceae bacterium]MBT5578047.1 cell division protein ZipA [Porticoccaceae bacterium]MBT7374540.1 cell division protein ZipA [Porticoccaceae bacterium]